MEAKQTSKNVIKYSRDSQLGVKLLSGSLGCPGTLEHREMAQISAGRGRSKR